MKQSAARALVAYATEAPRTVPTTPSTDTIEAIRVVLLEGAEAAADVGCKQSVPALFGVPELQPVQRPVPPAQSVHLSTARKQQKFPKQEEDAHEASLPVLQE